MKKINKNNYNEDNNDISDEEIIILTLKQTNLIKCLLFIREEYISLYYDMMKLIKQFKDDQINIDNL